MGVSDWIKDKFSSKRDVVPREPARTPMQPPEKQLPAGGAGFVSRIEQRSIEKTLRAREKAINAGTDVLSASARLQDARLGLEVATARLSDSDKIHAKDANEREHERLKSESDLEEEQHHVELRRLQREQELLEERERLRQARATYEPEKPSPSSSGRPNTIDVEPMGRENQEDQEFRADFVYATKADRMRMDLETQLRKDHGPENGWTQRQKEIAERMRKKLDEEIRAGE